MRSWCEERRGRSLLTPTSHHNPLYLSHPCYPIQNKQSVFTKQDSLSEAEIDTLFGVFDNDGNGIIDRPEVKRILSLRTAQSYTVKGGGNGLNEVDGYMDDGHFNGSRSAALTQQQVSGG